MVTKAHHPVKLFVLCFAGAIAAGTLLLMLPWSTAAGSIRWIDALFTATSAVCVTGLTVVGTGTTYTFFGQLVVLGLIQAGGLGIMTFGTFFALMLGHKASFQDQQFYKEQVSFISFRDLFKTLKHFFGFALLFEVIGALILWNRLLLYDPAPKATFSAIFHAISAFCNAGFSIYPENLERFQKDYLFCWTVMGLIVVGGLGCLVWEDLYEKYKAFKKRKKYALHLHTKLVLVVTVSLIVGGAVLIWIFEQSDLFRSMDLATSTTAAFFQSVTARTAGYNTVPIGLLSNPSLMVLMWLMFIGGSPASTAGGIKTTTFGVLTMVILARIRGKEEVNLFRRKIPFDVVTKTVAIFFVSFLWVLVVTLLLQITEHGTIVHETSHTAALSLLFETVSAFGTVGLSMGVTPVLSVLGKLLIVLTMFFGRLGPLTLAMAILSRPRRAPLYEYAEEKVMVG